MNGESKLWLIPAALIVAAGIASFSAQLWVLPGDVEATDWQAPAEYVLENIRPDDAVNVQPTWNEDAFPYLTQVGDQVVRQDTPLIEDIYDRRRLWLLVESDRLDEALARMPYDASETHEYGPVTVVRIDAPDEPLISYELLSHLDDAKVTQLKDDKVVERCTNWDASKRTWHCGRPDRWVYVGEEIVDMGGDPHRCIWAHPPANKKRVRIVYPDVPLGKTFRLRGGLNQRAIRSKRGTDVHLRVSVADGPSKQRTIPARETSWKPVDLDTSELSGQRRDITVEIWSETVFERLFCFNGWVFDR